MRASWWLWNKSTRVKVRLMCFLRSKLCTSHTRGSPIFDGPSGTTKTLSALSLSCFSRFLLSFPLLVVIKNILLSPPLRDFAIQHPAMTESQSQTMAILPYCPGTICLPRGPVTKTFLPFRMPSSCFPCSPFAGIVSIIESLSTPAIRKGKAG